MRHRRLTGVVLLGACLSLLAGRLYGQRWDTPAAAPREVIASSVPVSAETPATPAAPQPMTPPQPVVETIQQTTYIANPPSSAPATARPMPMLPPTASLGERTASEVAAPKPTSRAGTMAAMSVEVMGPDRLLLGQSLAYDIVLRNSGAQPVAEIHVEEPLPAGAARREDRAAGNDTR